MRKWILLLCVSAAGCEKPVEIELPPHAPRLVVHAQQQQGRIFRVRVGRSRGITDTIHNNNFEPFELLNARVLLERNGALVDTLRYNDANRAYEGRHRGQLGSVYTVKVSAPGYADAEGRSAFPDLVQPAAVGLRPGARVNSSGDSQDEIKLTINDPAGKANYYLIRLRSAHGGEIYCVQTPDLDVERLVYSDPFSGAVEECLDGDRLLVSDRNFNGKEKKLVFYVSSNQLNPFNGQDGRQVRPTLELRSINEDYFKYLKSLNALDNADGNPFAEPVNVVTNISNGYGLFTTFAATLDTLRR